MVRVPDHHDGEHGSRQAGMALEQEQRTYILIYRKEAERPNWEWHVLFETLKPTLSDTSPSARPYILILPKQLYQLETKHPNT